MRVLETFENEGVDYPLLETLRLFDLVSEGSLSFADSGIPGGEMDPAVIAMRRKEGVPLEYIIGEAVFMKRRFYCTPETLIPREETSLLVGVAVDLINDRDGGGSAPTVIEIGTGCGNIAVSVAMSCENAKVLASDVSEGAVEVANRNVDRYDLGERVKLFAGDLFAPFEDLGCEGKVDLVVCNPPYIPSGSLSRLAPEIFDHEPKVALDAGPYGIDFFRRLIEGAGPMLAPGGKLAFEIGEKQEKLVTRVLEKNGGFEDFGFFTDGNVTRVVSATKRI